MGDSGIVSIPIPIKPLIPIPAFLRNLIPIPIPKWLKISVIPESVPILESPIFGDTSTKTPQPPQYSD